MLMNFFEFAREWSAGAVVVRLIAATLVGTIIGMDRERKNKGAGIKTHVLVCLGSAMAMIVSEYLLHQFPDAKADLARIGAQVVSGVGFLGVGTIIIGRNNEVQGLTTAAGLWACSCIGLAAGAGYIEGTLIAMLFVIFTLTVLNVLDGMVRKNAKVFDIYVEFEDKTGVRELIKRLHSWDCTYSNFTLVKSEEGRFGGAATLTIEIPRTQHKHAFIDAIAYLPYVSFVDEL